MRRKKGKRKQNTISINADRTTMPASRAFKISKSLQAAVKHLQAGQLQQAEHIFRKVLVVDPNNATVNHLLGVISHQVGQNDEATHLIRKAIRCKPDYVEAHSDLGIVLQELGRPEEAAVSYRKAITIKPDFAEAHSNLGNALIEQGRLEEAAVSYRKAITVKPDYAQAHSNLGVALKEQGRLEEAAVSCRKAITIKPNYAGAHSNLGVVLKEQGRLEEAAVSCRKAISIKPDYAEAHNNLGNALKEQGRLEEAAVSYRKAITIKPDFAEAHSHLGVVFQGQGRLEEAVASYRKAITIKPNYAEAHSNLGVALKEQGRLEEAAVSYRKAITIKPGYAKAHSNLLFLLNSFPNISRKDIYNESLEWDQQHAKTLLKKEPVYANKKEKERKLKIGYVSSDFRTHSVSYFFEPLLKAHNKENVEVYCYSNVMTPDKVTERLKAEADHWFSIVGKNDEYVAEQIKRDGIDILVDLAGHTSDNRLLVFAYKPAPIQATWLGYPNTTGMSAIDYRFTDEVADPIGEADNLHSEALIRLESGFLCYSGDESAPEISALPCLERGHITFGSFNNLTKTTPEVVKLWSDIMRAAPNTHLLLKNKQLEDEGVRTKCLEMFEKEGISDDRIELYGMLLKKRDHLGFYSKIDIGLDPFPYNGTTTTYEALWMGIPVITLEGDRHAARVGTSIMTHLNLPQFIADTKENYTKKAVELAGDRKRLEVYRKELRSILKSSKSCDEHHFAKKIETAFREMWSTWCQSGLVFPVTIPGEDESSLESTTSQKISSPANNAVELNNRGEELFAQGKLQEAGEIFEKALRKNPHLAVIHNNLGVLQWQLGNAHTALNHLKKALSFEPENCETLANIEAVFQQMKETPRRDLEIV